MTKSINRRSFLGTAAVTGLAIPSTAVAQSPSGDITFSQKYQFEITPTMLIRRLDSGVIQANPWAISESDQNLMPYLTGEVAVPMTPEDLPACLVCANGDDAALSHQLPVPKRFVEFRLLGELPATELISDIVQARTLDQSLDLSFTILDRTEAGTGLRAGGASTQSSPHVLSPLVVWQTPSVGGYFFQFRGPDYTGMIPCAPEAPKHYHIELWKNVSFQKTQNLMNLHIAIWKASGRYCFALANSQGWPSCIKVCNPSWSDIYSSVLAALLSIGIAYFIAVTLSSLIAIFVYGSIGALAL